VLRDWPRLDPLAVLNAAKCSKKVVGCCWQIPDCLYPPANTHLALVSLVRLERRRQDMIERHIVSREDEKACGADRPSAVDPATPTAICRALVGAWRLFKVWSQRHHPPVRPEYRAESSNPKRLLCVKPAAVVCPAHALMMMRSAQPREVSRW